ncbi:MAG: tetratricopeptide repeat protein [Promethearchaeota archaeon]
MEDTYLLIKGHISKDSIVHEKLSTEAPSTPVQSYLDFIHERVPQFIFTDIKDARTFIIQDISALYFVKIFHVDGEFPFLMVRIVGHSYSKDEIQKISLKFSQFLDVNLGFDMLSNKIKDIILGIETYDFLRPFKSALASHATISDADKRLRLEEVLPKVTETKFAGDTGKKIEHYKYKLLAFNKEGKSEGVGMNVLANDVISLLMEGLPHGISKEEQAYIMYNFGLNCKLFGYHSTSNTFFREAREHFKELHYHNHEIFAILSEFLNMKLSKDIKGALNFILPFKEEIMNKDSLTNGFKGIVLRHIGESYQMLEMIDEAKLHYKIALEFLEKHYQLNIDMPLAYSSLGMISFSQGDFFEASKYFSFAVNISRLLKQDISGLVKNLGISYFNLAGEYLKTMKILALEKDHDRAVDIAMRGLGYLYLSSIHLGAMSLRDTVKLATDFDAEMSHWEIEDESASEGDLTSSLISSVNTFVSSLSDQRDDMAIRTLAKDQYEELNKFKPLKTYFFLVLFKGNGLAINSRTSSTLKELPTLDENLIAGMISGISSFLDEVLSGDEELSLIDRNNVKILFEHTEHLMGILFANKDHPQLREQIRSILRQTQIEGGDKIAKWNGDISFFEHLDDLMKTLVA